MDKHLVKTSKLLSLVLRHKPETIGLTLDEEGWVTVEELLDSLSKANRPLTFAQLKTVVEQNDKKRFVIRDGKIRANQGHSINVDLTLEHKEPPPILFHGTATRFLATIRAQGLKKMNRQHVHLSSELETAEKVGVRHGKLIVLRVDAAGMFANGYKFFLSENLVWLTDHVPSMFIKTNNPKGVLA